MATPLTTGDTAPDLTLQSLDGADRSLADFRGERLLVFFWGSW